MPALIALALAAGSMFARKRKWRRTDRRIRKQRLGAEDTDSATLNKSQQSEGSGEEVRRAAFSRTEVPLIGLPP